MKFKVIQSTLSVIILVCCHFLSSAQDKHTRHIYVISDEVESKLYEYVTSVGNQYSDSVSFKFVLHTAFAGDDSNVKKYFQLYCNPVIPHSAQIREPNVSDKGTDRFILVNKDLYELYFDYDYLFGAMDKSASVFSDNEPPIKRQAYIPGGYHIDFDSNYMVISNGPIENPQ